MSDNKCGHEWLASNCPVCERNRLTDEIERLRTHIALEQEYSEDLCKKGAEQQDLALSLQIRNRTMPNNSQIRRLIAADQDRVKGLLLTEQEHRVLRLVMRQEETSSNYVAWKLDISVQHAANVLRNLYKKGYVDRAEIPQESGGYEYEYISTINTLVTHREQESK